LTFSGQAIVFALNAQRINYSQIVLFPTCLPQGILQTANLWKLQPNLFLSFPTRLGIQYLARRFTTGYSSPEFCLAVAESATAFVIPMPYQVWGELQNI